MPHLKLTAREVLDALRRRHGAETGNGKWSVVEEAFCGWMSAGGGIDLLAIAAWQSARVPGLAPPADGEPWVKQPRHHVVAYEVKVSRSDYRREVDGKPDSLWTEKDLAGEPWRAAQVGTVKRYGRPGWPAKARHALERSHHYFFAVPEGLLKPHEIERREPWGDDPALPKSKPLWLPPEAGLLEVGATGRVKVIVPAPRREARTFLPQEVAELIRHALTPAMLRSAMERANNEAERSRAYVAGQDARIAELEAELAALRPGAGA